MDVARRLALGQWFTPPAVADLALSLALPPGGRAVHERLRVVDPACGDGAFLARAAARGIGTGAGGAVCGIELDPAVAAAARGRVSGARIVEDDLFALAPEALGAPFDAVVGNPPYVRQERLTRAQKQCVRARLGHDFPGLPAAALDRVLGRGDLAAACILRALRLARPGGRVALVVSSALLDAGYAAALWDVVLGCGRVRAVVDAPAERWFADAAVNAVILVLERTDATDAARGASVDASVGAAPPVRLARLSIPTAEAARQVGSLDDLARVSEVRHAPADQPARWAAHLRASATWFAFEAAAGAALVPLGALASVRRGVTSGANEVFYLPRERARALGIESDVLLPMVRSPRRAPAIAVEPGAATHVALVCPPAGDAWPRQPGARRYLEAHRHVAERPTLRARRPWWALPVRPARLFLTKAYAARFVQHLAPAPMVADQRVYTIHPAAGIQVELLAAVLNASFTALAIESLGRASMGDGALEWTVADAAYLPVLDPRRLEPGQAAAARQALLDMAARPLGEVTGERAAPDRRRLDRAVAAAAPGLAGMLETVWDALIASVAHRHARARQGQRQRQRG
jgi:adenine-specific DNA-methyltransferase